MKQTLIIGIAGGSGSGKSTLTEGLKARFGDDITVIRHDDYYKKQVGRTYEERAAVNYDCPDAFDTDLLIGHLAALKEGRAVDIPVYDYTVHNRSDRVRHIDPTPVIVLDGILILAIEPLRELLDIKLFVDTDADIRLMRRIERDAVERARSLGSVLKQYRDTVRPMHEQYVQPSAAYADLLIRNGGMNPVARDLLITKIETRIAAYFAE